MSNSLRRRFKPSQALPALVLGAGIALLLGACETTSPQPPYRVGLPDDNSAPGEDLPPPLFPTEPSGETLPDIVDGSIFEPTRRALATGDWMAAHLALPRPTGEPIEEQALPGTPPSGISDTAGTGAAMQAWISYYEARIDLLRGARTQYADTIHELRQRAIPANLRREIAEHELRLALLSGNRQQQVASIALLLGLAPDEATRTELEQRLWRALQGLSDAQRAAAASEVPALLPWTTLADAAMLPDGSASAAAIDAWLQRYPEHRATSRAQTLRTAAISDAQTQRLALMLPLSGPLQNASDVVADGFFAAYFGARDTLAVQVLDSRSYATPGDAYDAAEALGADVIVGPLGKREVGELLAREERSTPLLTLNRPEVDHPTQGALQLSLAPEDEALQLAELAWSRGARRVLLIRPDSNWGERMDSALRVRFRELGGVVPVTARYKDAAGYSDTIRDALALGASLTRGQEIRSLFQPRVETQGRRREDLDAIFLLPRNSDEARALKPLINYHFAGNLPVYAPSTADTGVNDPALNRDLAGLRILARPGRLQPETVPGAEASATPPGALYDLGADALALARRWWRMSSGAANASYGGLTGRVETGASGTLYRELRLAEFDRGVLREL